MNKQTFLKEFKSLLPDGLSETGINLDNIETTTLLWIGEVICNMTDESCEWYNSTLIEINDLLVDIVAKKYSIEW